MKNKTFFGFIVLCTILSSAGAVKAASNPAAQYCTGLGYNYSVVRGPGGGVVGVCTMPNGSSYDEWDFLFGKTGIDYGFCRTRGFEAKVVSDERCGHRECVMCVFGNGSEMESSEMLELERSGRPVKPPAKRGFTSLEPFAGLLFAALTILAAIAVFLLARKRGV